MKANTAVTTKSCRSKQTASSPRASRAGGSVAEKQAHDLRPFVVFTVFLQDETVDGERCHGVEEGEDTNGDKELSRGGVVPIQEEALAVLSFTGGSIKVDPMESDIKENKEEEQSRELKPVHVPAFGLWLL